MRFRQFTSLLIFTGFLAFSACSTPVGNTIDVTSAQTRIDVTRTATPMPVCTPPPCGENEAYHCPDTCPGGCGTVCATHTPVAENVVADQPVAMEAEPTNVPNVQSFPDPTAFAWRPVVEGLEKPLAVVHAGDRSGRLFLLEQPGRIRIFNGTNLLTTPFLDISQRVNDRSNEQGLLGLAFHPTYRQNGIFFVNYTGEKGDTFISRFQVSEDPNLADPDSETILLRISQPYGNHNGGQLLFGPDGNLYIGTGDGGSAGDPQGNAQNSDSLLGKVLRINVDFGNPYAIPSENPYTAGNGRPEIWANGLRNPWRFIFDKATGDLYIADVGQNQWEEINYLPGVLNGALPGGGSNFGWNYREGRHPFEGTPPDGLSLIDPIWEYDHSVGCSVTGGLVYRGAMTEWQGIYFYGDYCSGIIWGLLKDEVGTWQNQVLYQTRATLTSFGEDEAGEIYLIDRSGTISRLEKLP